MLRILGRIAEALNDAEVLWCVGGSLLLNQYGLAEHPHDIDLLVALSDAGKAAVLLGAMGEAVPCELSPTYSTEFFRKFRVDGCDVDLMAGFRLNHPSGCYEYAFDRSSVASVRRIGGIVAPFDVASVASDREIKGVPVSLDGASVASAREIKGVPVSLDGASVASAREIEGVPVTFDGASAASAREIEGVPVTFDGASAASAREIEGVPVTFDGVSVTSAREIKGVSVPFENASTASIREIGDTPIPFAALEDWYVVYQLIPGKEPKALRIEEYLRKHGIENLRLLERALTGCLPEIVRQRISALLKK